MGIQRISVLVKSSFTSKLQKLAEAYSVICVSSHIVVSALFYSFRNRGTVRLYRNQNLGLSMPLPFLRTHFSGT